MPLGPRRWLPGHDVDALLAISARHTDGKWLGGGSVGGKLLRGFGSDAFTGVAVDFWVTIGAAIGMEWEVRWHDDGRDTSRLAFIARILPPADPVSATAAVRIDGELGYGLQFTLTARNF
jgi:hypothetical protein